MTTGADLGSARAPLAERELLEIPKSSYGLLSYLGFYRDSLEFSGILLHREGLPKTSYDFLGHPGTSLDFLGPPRKPSEASRSVKTL